MTTPTHPFADIEQGPSVHTHGAALPEAQRARDALVRGLGSTEVRDLGVPMLRTSASLAPRTAGEWAIGSS
eukprot:15445774-Alexandrium_andersonii.AAC.1